MGLFRTYNPGRETRFGRRRINPPLPLRPEDLVPETGPDLPLEEKGRLGAAITAAIAADAFGSRVAPLRYSAARLAGAMMVKRPLSTAIPWAFGTHSPAEIRETIEAIAAVVPEVQLVATWIRDTVTDPSR